MPALIKNKTVLADDPWQIIWNLEEDGVSIAGNVIIPLRELQKNEEKFQTKQQNGELGLLIESDQAIDDIPENFHAFPVIALHFPVFTDGRAYSTARDLRRLAYKGELRAVGDVLIDQLHAMLRCGFDAFELGDHCNTEKALEAFDVFSHKYQGDEYEPRPIYHRHS